MNQFDKSPGYWCHGCKHNLMKDAPFFIPWRKYEHFCGLYILEKYPEFCRDYPACPGWEYRALENEWRGVIFRQYVKKHIMKVSS